MTNGIAGSTLNILIVDDEINIRKTLAVCLETDGHRVVAVSNSQDAVSEASRRSFDIAFVDLRLGATSGMDLIPALLSLSPWLKIVVITAYASIDTAVEAIRRGAADYIPKPFTPDQVKVAIEKASQVRLLEQRLDALQEDLKRTNPEVDLTTRAPAMQRVLEVARQVAESDATVLINGESGTGKGIVARAIHGWSHRAGKPLGVVSCPSLPPDLLESELFGHVKGAFTGAVRDNPGRIAACEGGTLLLDEIGDLPLSLQPKLLRFIQDRNYERIGDNRTRTADVRIIAATNVDLEQAVKGNRFREDLYYRLNVVQLEIPPLRGRRGDIVSLAEHLLVFFGRAHHRSFQGFTDEAKDALTQYEWPGNLRELRNAVERATILAPSDTIGLEYLPENIAGNRRDRTSTQARTLQEIEEQHIRR
ncbi:MAG: two-component system, NtrC family, response regulator AlgB, partial [Candidatus Hydrogenedentes bacterium]|nr:two-component system, NtrC family, response regulator AlgB [Candidatus Hydrogenedentota bacterium]